LQISELVLEYLFKFSGYEYRETELKVKPWSTCIISVL